MSQVNHYTQGILLYRAGRYKQAIEELELLQGRDDLLGRLGEYYLALCRRSMGIEAMRQGRFDVAERCLRAAMESIGREADLPAHLARLYAQNGRFDRCVAEMEKNVVSDSDSVEAHRKLAQAQWRSGHRAEACMTLYSALRKFGCESQLWVQLGLFYAAEERFDEARQALQKAVNADCTNAKAHRYLAMAAAAQGDVEAARRSFQRAFELNPGDLMSAYQLALAAKATAENGLTVMLHLPELFLPAGGSEIRQLASYITQEPDFVDAFLSLPDSEVDTELFGMLLGVVQTALAEQPRFADLHYHCSRIFQRLGRTTPAIEHAQKAIQINPQYVQAMIHLGRLLASAGRLAEAIEHLEKAVADGGDWPDIHCLIGELMQQSSLRTDAKRHLERALVLKTNYPRAAEALASLAA